MWLVYIFGFLNSNSKSINIKSKWEWISQEKYKDYL